MVIWDVMLAISGILEVLTKSDMLKYLIYTEEVWVQIWILLKSIRYRQRDKMVI